MLHLNQIVISPIHLSAMKAELLQKMMDKKITGISFENLKDDSGTYPDRPEHERDRRQRGDADRRSIPEFLQSWQRGPAGRDLRDTADESDHPGGRNRR